MKTQPHGKTGWATIGSIFFGMLMLTGMTPRAGADADPAFAFYGYQEIVPNPNPSILGENTHFTVTVSNLGDAAATNVAVQISFNDWGVTYNGWQPFGTQTIPSIAPGGTAVVQFDHIFLNRTHTCIEALITGADLNANPNNDRGQINMEVINAGETFGYNVPVVNNGNGEVKVQLFGGLRGDKQGTPPGPAKAPPIDRVAVIPAGGTLLVPVQIDFVPGTPSGTAVDYDLTAFDVARPNNAAGINHVRLHVVCNSPRGLKKDCLTRLNGLPPGMPLRQYSEQVDEIRKHIQNALEPKLWLDDFRLKPQAAQRVVEQEREAVKKLLQLLGRKGVPLNWKIELDACVRALTDADRILAQTAIKDGGGNPGAGEDLKIADDLRLAGKEAEAIKIYGHILGDHD